jgi:hypothetical protein
MSTRLFHLWALFGLRESPFFQETLAPGGPYPTELFVGREEETRRILITIGGSPSSRHVLHGPPGVGKTTLAQHAKDVLAREGFVVRWRPVAVSAGQTSVGLIVEILASVHEAILTMLPKAAGAEPMEEARGLVRTFRQRNVSGGVTVLGSGLQAGVEAGYVRPVGEGVSSEAWRLLVDLATLACRKQGAAGVLVHLNNFENLTTTDDLQSAGLVTN